MERYRTMSRENGDQISDINNGTRNRELGDTKKDTRPVPINKVGDYCKGEDENTTLPIEHKGVKPQLF